MSRAKADRPESLRDAQTWTTFNNEHIRAGMCFACASQGATGRQIGFSRVRQPCGQECRAGASRVLGLAGWLRPSLAGHTEVLRGSS